MAIQAHAWYGGWNQQSSVKNIETDVPLYNDSPLALLMQPPHFDLFPRADASVTTVGRQILEAKIDAMTRTQYWYIRHTYCNDGYSAKMTLYSLGNDGSWHYWNVTLNLQTENNFELVPGGGLLNVVITFVIDAEVSAP